MSKCISQEIPAFDAFIYATHYNQFSPIDDMHMAVVFLTMLDTVDYTRFVCAVVHCIWHLEQLIVCGFGSKKYIGIYAGTIKVQY